MPFTLHNFQEMVKKNKEIKRVKEEMKYFKLELLNREENFNKTFSRTPNVGVMQVVKPNANNRGHEKEVEACSSSHRHGRCASTTWVAEAKTRPPANERWASNAWKKVTSSLSCCHINQDVEFFP